MSQTFLEDIPEFLEIQRNSFLRVLDTGLIQALEKINPIVSTSQSECGLLFYPKEYVLVLPENTITEAFLQGKTYGCKIYVPAIIYEKEKKNISNSINLKSWSCLVAPKAPRSRALDSFGTSEALLQKNIPLAWNHQPPNISQNIEKQKQAYRKVKALTKTLGSTLWPAISANAWPRTWPVSYKEFKTIDIKNNLFQSERGYGVLVGPKGKASKGIALVPRDHKALTSALQAKSSKTKQYFSSLFISIGCDDASTKKSVRVQKNSTWFLSETHTVGYKPSTPFSPGNYTKREQSYSPNKNQNHLVLLGAKETRAQKGQVLLGAKGLGFVPCSVKARPNGMLRKTTTKNRGYFTFGLSFLSFGHFLRNLMCNSTLPLSLVRRTTKTNNLKTNLNFFSEEGEIQQDKKNNKKNDQIPFGLSQSSAYLNKKTNLGYKISLPSWSNLNYVGKEQAKNFVHAMDLQLGDKAAIKPLQLLRSFERRYEKSHTSLQLKDFLKRTNKHFINSSRGLTNTKLPIRYAVLSQKRHGEQITKENPVTSLAALQSTAQHAYSPTWCFSHHDQGMEQVNLKNTLITSEKKIKPLSKKEWVCIGVLPLMTPRGHFIINGSHRIIVSQMGRAPGLYYQIGEKLQATIVPAKGAWLRMSVKENDNGEIKVWVRITPQRKIPYKIFIETYKYLENWKSPENPQFKFLNLTYKAINSKIKHFDKHYAIGVISGQIQRTLLNFASYNLGTLGRKRINERLSINEKKGYLTSKDISLIKRNLLKNLGQNPTANFDDDIDHLQNRRVRTCGELLQSEISVGMARLKKTASKQLEDYANSNLSIIEKRSFQLKPKPLNSNSEGSPRDSGQKPVYSNDLDNNVLDTSDTTVSKAHLDLHALRALQSTQEENTAHLSYPVAQDFNPKISEESTKSSVMLSQGIGSKVLAQKPIPFLVSAKSLGQNCTPWSFKGSSLQRLSMPSTLLGRKGTKTGHQSRHHYGSWATPLTIPGGYLNGGLELKAHKNYGQGRLPLFLRRSHHQKNGSLILSSWFWSLQQEYRPLEQPRLLPLGNSLSWRRSYRQIKDIGIDREKKYQSSTIPLQTQDLILVRLKKTLGLPFRVGVNLLSTRAYTKALNSSWIVGRAAWQAWWRQGWLEAHYLAPSCLQSTAQPHPYDTKDCAVLRKHNQQSQHQEGVGDYGLRSKPLAQDFNGHGAFSTKKSQAKPKVLAKGHNGLWFSWQQSRLALISTGSQGPFGPKPQTQSNRVTGKGITTYQIQNEEQLNENLREVPKVIINQQKSRFSVDVSASGNTGGSRGQSRLAPFSTGSPPLSLEKSKQKKWSPYKVISTKAFAGALREFFGSNPLSQYMDQTNPLAEITHKRRLSSLGPGGVDRASAGIAIRGIHPSHYGRICPIETPEGKNAGLVNSMTMWARVNEDGFLETPYLKVKGGSIMSHTNTLSPDWSFVPTKKETRAFPDVQLAGVSSTYSKAYLLPTSSFANDLNSKNQKHQKLNALESLKNTARDCPTSQMIKIVTSDLNISESSFLPNISIPARDGAERSFERAKRAVVNFCGVSPTQNISVATSLIPFLEHDDATRALMGSNMQRQAVPLLKPQGPLVRTGLEGKVVGESGHALQANCSGVVSIATRTFISIETFQKKNCSDQNFSLKESFSFLPHTYINANKSLSFLRKKGNYSGANAFDPNFGTMPPLLCTSSWGDSVGGISNLGGCDLTSKLPIPKSFSTLRGKDLEFSAFKIQKTKKEKQKKLKTTFYNYTFDPKEYTYETATKKEPSAVLLGAKGYDHAKHLLSTPGLFAVHAVHAKNSMHNIAKARPKNKQVQSINFSRVTELINQYNFILANRNPNSSTSASRDSRWFQNNGSVLCHNMSKNLSRKSPLIERKTKTQKLQEYARSNQATICVQRPAVKTGDWVQKGDLIGDCSASVNGVLSLGKNIVVAYLPMEGFNFEDAIVVSDRLVHEELYTSIHVQRVEFDMDAYVKKYIPKKIKIKKQKAAYKTTGQDWITKHNPHLLQTEKELLNPLGIIKVGSWVGPGDVLVSKVVPVDRKIAPSRHLLLAVFQEKRTKTLDTDDTSLRVPKGIHGRVINVKVVGSGTVIPLDRNRFSVKKAISTKREKLLPFFNSGNKTKVNSLTGSEDLFWPLAQFTVPLPLAKVDQRAKPCFLKGLSSTRPQKDRPLISEAPQEVVLASSACFAKHACEAKHDHNAPTSAQQDPLKSKAFDPALKQLKPKASVVPISKMALRQDLLTLSPRVKQDLKKNYATGILKILHQFKKRTNLIDFSIDSHPRAFAVAKKVAFFPSFDGHALQSMHGGHFGGQAKDLTVACASLAAPKAPRSTAQQGIKKDGSVPTVHPVQSMHAKKGNLTDTGIIDLDLTTQNKGYSEYAEKRSKSIIPALEKKKIDGEYKIIQVRIYIAERKKLQVGDKMSGRHGNKGIVSTILPREDMPFLPDGTSVDMVLNPLGIPSRMNVGQVFECLLGLASSVCGEIIGHTPFDEMYGPEASRSLVYLFLYLARLRSRTDWLFQPNFPGKTIVFDGRTGLPFEQWVTVGRAYMLKLIHMVDEKIHARSIGPRSLVTQQPVKGRARGGGQRLGEMELWALEGFGAAYTLQEILTLKSDDIRGRENVENSIIFSTTAKAHIPETFRMMLFELRCLCLNVELN